MVRRAIAGLVFAGCAAFLIGYGVNTVNKDYSTERLSSPYMENILPSNANFMTKLEYFIDGYPVISSVSSETNTSVNKESPLKESMKSEYLNANHITNTVVGWINIPGTDINYPINYNSKDNNYYLHHNWDNKKYWNGSVFLDSTNKGFDDWTLINGHDMLNGIMFAQLTKYKDKKFAESNPYVYIYEGLNKNSFVKYKILGATYVPDNVQFNVGNLSKEEMSNQFNTLLKNPLYKIGDYNGNNILMLNTCLSNGTTNHIILLAEQV